MAPSWNPGQKGVKVQIIDVFALELATGYEKDPEGRLLLSSRQPMLRLLIATAAGLWQYPAFDLEEYLEWSGNWLFAEDRK
ncbi:hypothetical protein OGCDGJMD_00816 [Cyanobium usitatum str. Tous]|jgi:hypothetical protein|uniref:hypothetical protein n=1 Tax=Cyanobium usitatum TaxID=2304190 RepID=UPI002AD485BD|nr:hypothetical protein [Cyanobium usitatum]CAK6690364.1 hypothetical protein OGCDGJMD_00816 [Cyanobium usitatum str. Tous]